MASEASKEGQPKAEVTSFFSLCQAFEVIRQCKKRSEKLANCRLLWQQMGAHDLFPFLRLMIPSLDTARRSYGFREQNLAKVIIRHLALNKDTSHDAKQLLAWKDPRFGHTGTTFVDAVVFVLKKRARPETHEALGRPPFSVAELNRKLTELSTADHTEARESILRSIFDRCTVIELATVLRIILKDQRLGTRDDSLLAAFHPAASETYNATTDLEATLATVSTTPVNTAATRQAGPGGSAGGGGASAYGGRSVRSGGGPSTAQSWSAVPRATAAAQHIRVGRHFRPMLCGSLPLERMAMAIEAGKGGLWVEPKLDGERIVAHILDGRVTLFSRGGKDYTSLYQELVQPLRQQVSAASAVLDGEVLVWCGASTSWLPFGSNKTYAAAAHAARVVRDGSDSDDGAAGTWAAGDRASTTAAGRSRHGASSHHGGTGVSNSQCSNEGVCTHQQLVFVIFDAVVRDGANLAPHPLSERRAAMLAMVPPPDPRVSPLLSFFQKGGARGVAIAPPRSSVGGTTLGGSIAVRSVADGVTVSHRTHRRGDGTTVTGTAATAAALSRPMPPICAVPAVKVSTMAEVLRALDAEIGAGNEGVVVKSASAPYVPGERRHKWLKLKPDAVEGLLDTVDAVVMGGYFGSKFKKRALTHFLIGVPCSETGGGGGCSGHSTTVQLSDVGVHTPGSSTGGPSPLSPLAASASSPRGRKCSGWIPIGKIGSGYDEREWSTFAQRIDWKHYDSSSPPAVFNGWRPAHDDVPDRWCVPEESIVVEVAAYAVIPTIKFPGGVTLRFPKFRRCRFDKAPSDATSFGRVKEMSQSLVAGRAADLAAVIAKVAAAETDAPRRKYGRGGGGLKRRRPATMKDTVTDPGAKRLHEVATRLGCDGCSGEAPLPPGVELLEREVLRHAHRQCLEGVKVAVLTPPPLQAHSDVCKFIRQHGGTPLLVCESADVAVTYVPYGGGGGGVAATFVEGDEEGEDSWVGLRGQSVCLRVGRAAESYPKLDILTTEWLARCVAEGTLAEPRFEDVVRASVATAAWLRDRYDAAGDSYVEPVGTTQFARLMARMRESKLRTRTRAPPPVKCERPVADVKGQRGEGSDVPACDGGENVNGGASAALSLVRRDASPAATAGRPEGRVNVLRDLVGLGGEGPLHGIEEACVTSARVGLQAAAATKAIAVALEDASRTVFEVTQREVVPHTHARSLRNLLPRTFFPATLGVQDACGLSLCPLSGWVVAFVLYTPSASVRRAAVARACFAADSVVHTSAVEEHLNNAAAAVDYANYIASTASAHVYGCVTVFLGEAVPHRDQLEELLRAGRGGVDGVTGRVAGTRVMDVSASQLDLSGVTHVVLLPSGVLDSSPSEPAGAGASPFTAGRLGEQLDVDSGAAVVVDGLKSDQKLNDGVVVLTQNLWGAVLRAARESILR